MLPPAPEPGVVPVVRLKRPLGVPSLKVPEIEIGPVAWIAISPPWPVLVVPLSICAPPPRDSEPVVMEIFPALPQGPEQLPPIVRVKIPLDSLDPRSKRLVSTGGVFRCPVMDMLFAVMVTSPPRPLVSEVVSTRAPPVMTNCGVLMIIAPELPRFPSPPREFVNNPDGLNRAPRVVVSSERVT